MVAPSLTPPPPFQPRGEVYPTGEPARALLPVALLAAALSQMDSAFSADITLRFCALLLAALAAALLWRALARVGLGARSPVSPNSLPHWLAVTGVIARILALCTVWCQAQSVPTQLLREPGFAWAATDGLYWTSLVTHLLPYVCVQSRRISNFVNAVFSPFDSL
jgi:hypothetical protein